DRDADARTADDDAALGLAAGDRLAHGGAVVRIVDRRGGVGAEVKHSVTCLLQVALENLLQVEAGVIRRDRDGGPRHRDWTPLYRLSPRIPHRGDRCHVGPQIMETTHKTLIRKRKRARRTGPFRVGRRSYLVAG